eukprot:TRINITY_DN3301_c0_g2_i1.p1 TRINITY_DN3301_c0_g2~~TRINITY_DN3301_c0_g2_i1.p1  ORF type:complete len:675 (+),score=245.98 TRINITY_DN3301_c0_g2_i1:94-2118(+)
MAARQLAPAGIKDALGRLFLKIHPDLLWATPDRRKVNEASMQGLNEILAWEKNLRRGQLQQPPSTRKVEFFCRDEEKKIGAEFTLPAGFTAEPHSVPEATKAVNTFLQRLLVRGEVLTYKEQAAMDSVSEEYMKKWKDVSSTPSIKIRDVAGKVDESKGWGQRRKEARAMQPYDAMGDFGVAFDGMDLEVPEGAHEAAERRHKTTDDLAMEQGELKVPIQPLKRVSAQRPKAVLGGLADDFNEMMKDMWRPENVPDITELISTDQIHYSQSLSPVDCARAVETLRDNLSSMRYDKWYFVPLYITDRFGVESDMDGFLSVPYWFEVVDFLQFLHDNEDRIRAVQDRAFSGAKALESLVNAARESTGMVDVVLRCAHTQAEAALRVLIECGPELQRRGLKDLVLEVIEEGWQYGARESGVLQIPVDVERDGLLEFAEYMNTNDYLPQLKEAYEGTVKKLSELDRLMSVCYEVIGPQIIDVEGSDAPLEQKVQFITELYGISGELSKYDWGGYTFALGPLDLDWDTCVLTLPHNFHGPNFARTVHMLHEEDQKVAGDAEDTPSEEQVSLDLEARRIKQELVATGLLELDPAKQTAEQATLMKMVENYSTSEDDIQTYLKESFPQYTQKLQEKTAHDQALIASVRMKHSDYMNKKLRRYFKNKRRMRIGPTAESWDFL